MAGFTVMNVNVWLHDSHKKEFLEEILEIKPDIICLQGGRSQKQIHGIDNFLQMNELYYSHYHRITKKGLTSILIKSSTFKFELIKRDKLNVGTPENRRKLFNGLTCVKLTHMETKAVIYAGSWHSDAIDDSIQTDDVLLLTKSMGYASQNGMWLIGGSFVDENANIENRFLIGFSKHQEQRLYIKNVNASHIWGIENCPSTASIEISKKLKGCC